MQKVKQQKMEFYEAFVDGKVTKEGYLRKKELLTQKEHRYKELITELQEQIIQAEEKRKLAKSPELLAFSKCKDLTELSSLNILLLSLYHPRKLHRIPSFAVLLSAPFLHSLFYGFSVLKDSGFY